jgi:hypothetical protein
MTPLHVVESVYLAVCVWFVIQCLIGFPPDED